MKTRSSLVSNSSTSSFIIVGYKLSYDDNDPETIQNLAKKFGQDIPLENCDSDFFYELVGNSNNFFLDGESGNLYVGVVIADVSSDGDCLDDNEYDLNDVVQKCNELGEKYGLSGSPKLYTGSKNC